MSHRAGVVTIGHQRIAPGTRHVFMVPMMRCHFPHLLGGAVRAVVLAGDGIRTRRNDEIQPEYGEHGEQPAACR